jgi:type VI secretion system Hcp family effector
VIHACVITEDSGAPVTTGANVRVIDPTRGQACNGATEANLTWNQQGPAGAQGPPGAQGATGAQGAPGTPGAPGQRGARGPAVTIAGGNVITIAGTPITVGSSHGVTISSPPVTGTSKPIGTVTLDLGGSTLSFKLLSYGLATGQGGGGVAGRAAIHEIVITKLLDKASTRLARYCATGKHIAKGTIVVRKAGRDQHFVVINLNSVVVSSYDTSSGGASQTPVESVSLNFTKVEFKNT